MKKIILSLVFILICNYVSAQFNQLVWNKNSEKDLSHYNIYRSNDFLGPYVMLNLTTKTLALSWIVNKEDVVSTKTIKTIVYTSFKNIMVKDNLYVDTDVTVGQVYWYKITATDISGNESGFSNKCGSMVVDKEPPVNPTGLR